jgi:hypothetical protein
MDGNGEQRCRTEHRVRQAANESIRQDLRHDFFPLSWRAAVSELPCNIADNSDTNIATPWTNQGRTYAVSLAFLWRKILAEPLFEAPSSMVAHAIARARAIDMIPFQGGVLHI